jgi:type IV secretion system protein TrbL
MVLMLGIGVQLTTGVANGLAEGTQRAIGTALPGVILILIACIAPVALFKLLAFVDPNTSSGAALRTGMAEVGGVRGLLAGGDTDDTGAGVDTGFACRSQGEVASEDATDTRLQHAQAGLLRTVGGPPRGAAPTAQGTHYAFGSRAIAIGSDLTNQMGVGHMSYHPDLSRDRSRTGDSTANANDPGHDGPNEQPDQGMPNDPRLAVTSADPAPPAPAPSSTNRGGLGGGAGEAGGSAAGGAAEAAAAVPIVPV